MGVFCSLLALFRIACAAWVGCRAVLLVRQSYMHFFLDKKVPKKSRLCIVSPACSQLCLWSGRGRTGKARMPRISKLALVPSVLRFSGWVSGCFCWLVEWFSAQTLICFIGILAFPVLNATRPVARLARRGLGASSAGRCGSPSGGAVLAKSHRVHSLHPVFCRGRLGLSESSAGLGIW
jgi:hypothetical protein